jgi:hypothetical protein
MFIYNSILKIWDERGLKIMLIGVIIFFIVYWFLFTSDNQNGTYNQMDFSFMKKTPQQPTYIPNYQNAEIRPYNKSPLPKCSKGEAECRRVLEKIFNVSFPNVRPNFMKNQVTGENLELDMYNPGLKLACEYHGQQHYKFNKWMHKNSSNFQNQKYRDIMKRDLCKQYSINLIEVPYTVKHHEIETFIINRLKKINYIQ